ncbi:uncharacterized protein (TIGR02145 family) [Larkinella arboricola]|uniref:Uncharacterized protein (TIGR02145 family) n=1 Tax=Larkinella arboricola TaxID=643671 RepID=A0A327X1Q1_LARAB|nr:FISUMP domain-containing protein [Larkinella arboricola]RAK00102.1 uncharacterized protein (TIGR02145 family) [Larkinella arboricola]
MKSVQRLLSKAALLALVVSTLTSCNKEPVAPVEGGGGNEEMPNTPYTSIPDDLVGTWYASHNNGPLTKNWENKTFQGEAGFREFRTMIFTKDGKNAVEYTSEVYSGSGGEEKQYLYKITGTLEYQAKPAQLTFHAQSGVMRIFSNQSPGYKESPIKADDLKNYFSVLRNPQGTTFPNETNYLKAQRFDGGNQYSVEYTKVGNDVPNSPGGNGSYSKPPTSGSYVQIGKQYYPTVTIGSQEWMSVNYDGGVGGLKDGNKPQYGTYCKYADLPNVIKIPAGWRLPSRQDFVKLLESQGLALNDWGSTDGSDLASKKKLGQLMAATGWKKQDGYANNKSGFNAVPGNLRVLNGNPNGEGTNCLLWTSDLNEEEIPIAFELIQLPSDTYAKFGAYPVGYNPPYLPIRLVRDK